MRGKYIVTSEDRRKLFHSLCELCRSPFEQQDLISTQLSMCNCADLLEELGYNQEDLEVNGWEGELWGYYTHSTAPAIYVRAEAYDGSLTIGFSKADDDEKIDTDALKEVIRKYWGNYFPVV